MKNILSLLFVFCLSSCSGSSWKVRNEPTTDKEREAVAKQVTTILSSTPQSLSGNDQDWDDAIEAATKSAKESLCQPTLWEWDKWSLTFTGKWKQISPE